MDTWKTTPNALSTERVDPVTRTLLVEDDVALLGAMQESLEARGFEVTCVTDGMSALEALRACDFDVVLMDLGLAAMGGSKLLHGIRRDPLVDDVPVVVLSGADDRTVERAASARVYAVHRKPARMGSVVRSLRHAAYYG